MMNRSDFVTKILDNHDPLDKSEALHQMADYLGALSRNDGSRLIGRASDADLAMLSKTFKQNYSVDPALRGDERIHAEIDRRDGLRAITASWSRHRPCCDGDRHCRGKTWQAARCHCGPTGREASGSETPALTPLLMAAALECKAGQILQARRPVVLRLLCLLRG
ncbi:hypothetical protein ACTJJ7_27595 [Phyllobacterium sp. 22229]|uniref:hypothetical protein n=1 Tax=Phyllobacterium TaxID=28100 RepID=UPI00102C956B|nr:hypothetical protein [Phyllobacterium myrsinacearum]